MAGIRILHVVSSLSEVSGVMSVIMNYYRHIDRSKVQFDFFYFKEFDNSYKVEIENLGGKTFMFSRPSMSNKFMNELEMFFSQQKGQYAALHIHTVYLTFLLAPVAKRFGINHIIAHSHSTKYSDKPLNAIRNRIVCLGLKKHANHYFACSKAAGEFLFGRKSFSEGKVTVINNAIECEKFKYNEAVRNSIRKELGLEDHLVIGHVGRFSEQKNHLFLINVFNELQKQKENIKLVLVGEGLLFNLVKEKVNSLNLNRDVLLLGKRDDVSDLLQAMDIFVLPSLFEGLPVAAIEAQASGLPVIMSTNITREVGIINAHYIELRKKPRFWADYILKIGKNMDRENAVHILREKGFDISAEVEKLEKIYVNIGRLSNYD